MKKTNLYGLLLISYLLSGCSLLSFLTESEESKVAREEEKVRIVLDRPDSEQVLDQLERHFAQIYSLEGLEEAVALANAKKEVRREVQRLMAIGVRSPEVVADDDWVKNRAAAAQKKFTEAPKSLCEACATASGKLLTIMRESLARPLPRADKKKIRQSIDTALRQPDAKQLLARAQEVREQIYIACNPNMAIEVAKDFALQDVYEKLGYVSASFVNTSHPKYVTRFCIETGIHLQNLQNSFPQAPYKLCKVYVNCWDGLQAIMAEAHGGYYEG